ncbi:MAG: SH3 domain-containing protein [Anaerolineae bacterium]
MHSRLSLLLICVLMVVPTAISQTVDCGSGSPSRLVQGERAQVFANGGSNMRIRPGTDASLLNIIPPNTIIPVVEGPFCSESLTWWQVDYEGERGWAAEGTDGFYWLAPYIIQRAQIGTVRVEAQPNLASDIRIQRQSDPPRSVFAFDGYPVLSEQIVPFIVVFDSVPETAEATPRLVAQLIAINDGFRRLELLFEEPLSADSAITLVYHYNQRTADGRLIDAYFPVSAPELPLPYPDETDNPDETRRTYFEANTDALSALSQDAFTPTLEQLDMLIYSIQINAPLAESERLSATVEGWQLDYHPLLATDINSQTDEIGTHLILRDYPEGQAHITVVEAQTLSGNILATLQQILNREPSNPPRIPLIINTDIPQARADLRYLRFGDGEGVRYSAQFTDDERFYGYQGLSDDGQYVISAILPITDASPPLDLLDEMISSLRYTLDSDR